MRSSVRPSYLNTILRRGCSSAARGGASTMVVVVVVLPLPLPLATCLTWPPTEKTASHEDETAAFVCKLRYKPAPKGKVTGESGGGSGERICSNDGHASVVLAAVAALQTLEPVASCCLFCGPHWLLVLWWTENGKSCPCSCLSISSRCSCSPPWGNQMRLPLEESFLRWQCPRSPSPRNIELQLAGALWEAFSNSIFH